MRRIFGVSIMRVRVCVRERERERERERKREMCTYRYKFVLLNYQITLFLGEISLLPASVEQIYE